MVQVMNFEKTVTAKNIPGPIRKPSQNQHKYTFACTAVETEPGMHYF